MADKKVEGKLISKKIIYLICFLIVFLLVCFLWSCNNKAVGVVVITFDVNAEDASFENGDKVMTKPVKVNTAFIPIDEEPKREGFVFTGWCLDKIGQSPIKSNFITIKSITIYASWIDVKEYEHEIYINQDVKEYFSDDIPLKAKYDTKITFNVYPKPGYEVKEDSFGYYEGHNKDNFVKISYSEINPQTFKMPATSITITLEMQKIQYTLSKGFKSESLKGDVADIYFSSHAAGFDEHIIYSIIPNYNYYVKDKSIVGATLINEESIMKGKIKMEKSDAFILLNIQRIDYSVKYPITIKSNIESFNVADLDIPTEASVGEFIFVNTNKLRQDYKINEIRVNGASNAMEHSGFYMPNESSVLVDFDLIPLNKSQEYNLTIERNVSKGEIISTKSKYLPGEKIDIAISGLDDYYVESVFLSGNPVSLEQIYMPEEDAILSINICEIKNLIKVNYDENQGDVWISYNKQAIQTSNLQIFVKPNREYKIKSIYIDEVNVDQSLFYTNYDNYYTFTTYGLYYVYTLKNDCNNFGIEFIENSRKIDFELVDNDSMVDMETISTKDNCIYDLEILTFQIKQLEKTRVKEIQISQRTSENVLVGNLITINKNEILDKKEISYFLKHIGENVAKLKIEVSALTDGVFYQIQEYIGRFAENPMDIDLIPEYGQVKQGDSVKIYIKHYTFDSDFKVSYSGVEKIISPNEDFFIIGGISNHIAFSVTKKPLNSEKEVKINLTCDLRNAVEINKSKFYVGEKAIISIKEDFYNEYYIDSLLNTSEGNIEMDCCFTIDSSFLETLNILVTLKRKKNNIKSINEIYDLALCSNVFKKITLFESIYEKSEIFSLESFHAVEFYSSYVSSILQLLTKNDLPIYIIELKDRKISNELLSIVKVLLDNKNAMLSDAYIQGNHLIISYISNAKEIYYSLTNEDSFVMVNDSKIVYYTLSDKTLGVFSYVGNKNCVIIPKNYNGVYISTNDIIQTLDNKTIIANYIKI